MLHFNTKKNMNNGYSICFNEWALDSDIKNELNLLLIISSLTAEKGYCFASNKYFAELFETNETLISRKIKKLEKKKYIIIEYEKKGSQIISRKIRLSKMITVDYLKSKPSIIEKDKDNNISINNTSINKYSKPTLEEVEDYCKERNNNVDPKKFYDYYSVNNWVDNKGNKVRNWKQKLITWEKHSPDNIELPEWFNKDIKANATLEEQEEMENILKEFV